MKGARNRGKSVSGEGTACKKSQSSEEHGCFKEQQGGLCGWSRGIEGEGQEENLGRECRAKRKVC